MKPEKNEKNIKAKSVKVSKKKGNNKLIIGAVAIILIVGIAYVLLPGGSPTDSPRKLTTLKEVRAMIDQKYSGPEREPTKTPPVADGYTPILSPKVAGKFPDYVYTNPMTLKAYTYATEHPDILEQIPCYCNCGIHGSKMSNGEPHRFLRDCFINDKGQYDDHASYCDVCVGEAIMVETYFPYGLTNTSTTSGIPTTTSVKSASVDLSALSLPDNFKNLADGLKLTPAGVNRAYFINTRTLARTYMEALVQTSVRPDSFYGKKIVGMYSADFNVNSWIELHDLGYDNKNDLSIKGNIETGMKNIVITRPLIYGHSQNVDDVLNLMKNPNSINTAYSTYAPLLDAVDYQNAAYALVLDERNKFSDINYMGMTPAGGKVELVKAFKITDNKSIPAGFGKYNPEIKGNILIIKMTGDFSTVQTESDNIDAVART